MRRLMLNYKACLFQIFDDEYVLVGSANINQRSLGGNRDSEIAVGAFQPGHTVSEEGDPRGSVHTYRMEGTRCLPWWAEATRCA